MKESYEMFYQLVFGLIAMWIIFAFLNISIVPLMVFGLIVFVIRVYKRQEVLDNET